MSSSSAANIKHPTFCALDSPLFMLLKFIEIVEIFCDIGDEKETVIALDRRIGVSNFSASRPALP